MRPEISVIIPTLNGAATLPEVLGAIAAQKGAGPVEVIVIDSGSTDATRAIAASFRVGWHEIDRRRFSHPVARNLGARLARGKYLVFLSQDAVPEGPLWLKRLIDPLKFLPQAAGSYSRQLPRADAPPWEFWDVSTGARPHSGVQRLPDTETFTPRELRRRIKFSNVASCIKKEIWQQIPFDERLPAMEDQAWALAALRSGYAIVYCAESRVRHSHMFTPAQYFRRHYQFGAAEAKFLPGKKSLAASIRYIAVQPCLDIIYFYLRKGLSWANFHWIFCPFVIRFCLEAGQALGRRLGAD